MGIIFTVVGLFSTTVLFSICMSCYKCFMKRRAKALAARTVIEQERSLAANSAAGVTDKTSNGAVASTAPSLSNDSTVHQTQKCRGTSRKHPIKSGYANGLKYPKATSSVVHSKKNATTEQYFELDSEPTLQLSLIHI